VLQTAAGVGIAGAIEAWTWIARRRGWST